MLESFSALVFALILFKIAILWLRPSFITQSIAFFAKHLTWLKQLYLLLAYGLFGVIIYLDIPMEIVTLVMVFSMLVVGASLMSLSGMIEQIDGLERYARKNRALLLFWIAFVAYGVVDIFIR